MTEQVVPLDGGEPPGALVPEPHRPQTPRRVVAALLAPLVNRPQKHLLQEIELALDGVWRHFQQSQVPPVNDFQARDFGGRAVAQAGLFNP